MTSSPSYGRRLMQWLGAALDAPGTRLLERATGEREISVNRLAIGVAVLAYVGALSARAGLTSVPLTIAVVAYVLAGIALFLDVRLRPRRSPQRRYLSLFLDLGTLSFALSCLAPYTVPLIPFYTWIVLGYAFRFGIIYLRTAAVFSLAAFSIVVATSPYWSEQPFLVAAVAGLLLLIPAYVEALLRKTVAAMLREQASNRAKAFVLSCIGHDLRTPLSAVIGMADQLGGTALDPDQRTVLDRMRQSARSILSDMDALLDISRIENGHTTVTTTEFNMLGLVEEIVALMGGEARAKGLQLAVHMAPTTPLFVQTDRRHLGKILLHLLQNAIRFTLVGSVLVSIASRASGQGTRLLRVEVIDTGIGIPRHLRSLIFEAYSQANEDVLQQHKGAGLGLTIAKDLVEMLGGRIGVDSDVGGGSTFWIEVPARARSHDRRPDLTGVGVILLSQEPNRVRALGTRMERLGARVLLLERGDQASAAAFASGLDECQRIAMVLDARDIEPVAMALAVRKNPLFGRIPLILLGATRDLPSPTVQHHYVTAISDTSSDEEVWTALQIAGPLEENPGTAMHTASTPAEPPASALGPLRILVADGSHTSQVVVTQMLTRAGHAVETVEDGEAALDALERAPFDLAIMALDMPGAEDASRLYRVISSGGSHLPIIGLATGAAADGERRCAAASMDACLAKPVDRARLLQVIAEIVCVPPSPDRFGPAEVTARPGVTPISCHPQFKSGLGPPSADEFDQLAADADPRALAAIAHAFQDDCRAALGYLTAAVSSSDLESFRIQVQALRSSARAIGAERLDSLCRAGIGIEGGGLHDQGKALVTQITREVDRLYEGLIERAEHLAVGQR